MSRATFPILVLLGLSACNMDILRPAGPVLVVEDKLLVETTAAMLIVVLTVLALTVFFAWRYRETAPPNRYDEKFDSSLPVELTIWSIPLSIIIVLGTLAWKSTIALDPFKPLPNKPILNIDVVSMDWKWLFIYPNQRIATINQLVIPTNTDIAFDITSDTVMNVFFIPRLGTQIYAMAGMRTQDHLLAKNQGIFRGLSANFSGEGFPEMQFQTKAVSPQDFAAWIKNAQALPTKLDKSAYAALQKPGVHDAPEIFGEADPSLFTAILQERSGTQMPPMKNTPPFIEAQ